MTLQKKFVLTLAALLVGFIITAVVFSSISQANRIHEQATSESANLKSEVARLLGLTDAIMSERVKSSMTLLMQRGSDLGEPSLGSSISVGAARAPQLLLGGSEQANNFDLVDGLTQVMDGTATLFSREGDRFIRISTNVLRDGKRAIGTELAPDGAAIKAVLSGKAFYGQVDILGQPYLTGYEPIKSQRGETVARRNPVFCALGI
mgnify:FL=1